MAIATSRQDAIHLATDWIGHALEGYMACDEICGILIGQAALFLLMGFDTSELRVWKDQYDRVEVVPRSILIDG